MFNYSDKDNKEKFLSKCYEWINTPELGVLVEKFNGKIPENLENGDKLRWLVEFSEIWDFRRAQKTVYDSKTGEKARWLVDDSTLSEQQKLATKNAIERLGLLGHSLPNQKVYDYVIVLGGARMACLFRMKYAKKLCDTYMVGIQEMVGLTGMRPISESERSLTDTYAFGASTEFDLMCASVKHVFKEVRNTIIQKGMDENINRSWAIAKYEGSIPITVLAAPSSEPDTRRANTADTFNFWVKQREIQAGKQILLVTSQIYVPYQQLEAARILGLGYGHSVETVGFPIEWSVHTQGTQTAANYLQEIRSTLLSMSKLL